jgi:hypothetical protein
LLDGLSEEQPERRSDRAELLGRRERDVHLQGVRQQEDPVDRAAPTHVGVMDGPVVVVHRLRPVFLAEHPTNLSQPAPAISSTTSHR